MQALRVTAAVLGVALALTTTQSVMRALLVTRGQVGLLPRLVDRAVTRTLRLVSSRFRSYESRDRVLSAEAPLILAGTPMLWLLLYEVAYSLLLWPGTGDLGIAAREAGSSMFTLGFASSQGVAPTLIDLLAALTGLVVVTLQIAYLPTLYGAYNRRETEVTLLEARSGEPAWGPELLARTRYAIGREDLAPFYAAWERWAADVAETHVSYPVLMRFRSPRAYSSWLIALLAVTDSAALFHAVAPGAAPIEARLCIRMGFTCLRQLSGAVGILVDPDPRPDAPLSLTFEEFRQAVSRLADVGFPMERSAEEAWPHFRGWRVNYEALAQHLAYELDVVPALWSGPRRRGLKPIPTQRPANRTPEDPDGSRRRPQATPTPAQTGASAPEASNPAAAGASRGDEGAAGR
ncbi:MAG: hypothetical protein NVSMB29_12920 [Candidatus Dormibacteria bacterium]